MNYKPYVILVFSIILATAFVNGQDTVPKLSLSDENSPNSPKYVVIAIDTSKSINNSNLEKVTNNKIGELINSKHVNKIGIIGFNTSSKIIQNLTETYGNKISIRITNTSGNTCLGEGLNGARELLDKEDSGDKEIIIISDFNEEHCDKNESVCNIAEKIKRDGIFISVENVTGKTPQGYANCIKSNNSSESESPRISNVKSNFSEVYSSEKIPITASGNYSTWKNPATNITISKIIKNGEKGPTIVLRIETPPSTEVSHDIVFAVDSSGSMDFGGDPTYGESVKYAIQKALLHLKSKDIKKNINVSFFSWDDNIDFAYKDESPNPLLSGFGNSNLSNSKFVPIDDAIKDNDNEKVFYYEPSDDLPSAVMRLVWPLSRDTNAKEGTCYMCSEDEYTNISLALNSAKIILEKRAKENYTSKKSAILIVGRSEFNMKENIDVYDDSEFGIYTLGVGVIDTSELSQKLQEIADDAKGKHLDTAGTKKWTYTDLERTADDITQLLDDILLRDYYARNITIIESLYPYLKTDKELISVKVANGTSGNIKLMVKEEPDGTSTLSLQLDGLLPGDTAEIFIPTEISLCLPVEINQNRKTQWIAPISAVDSSRVSRIEYTCYNETYSTNLPESQLRINK
jgi:Mg-chelatase subunit ChlD